MAGCGRDGAFDALFADVPGDVAAIEGNGVLPTIGDRGWLHPDIDAFGTGSNSSAIAGVDIGIEHGEGQGAIHHAGVEVDESERSSQRRTQCAFAGPSGAIDGDCAGSIHATSCNRLYIRDYTVLQRLPEHNGGTCAMNGRLPMVRRWGWVALLGCAVVLGALLRGQALYRWDGVAMQHPDERFLVYTAYYASVPPDFRSYLTTSCPPTASVPAAPSGSADRTAKLSPDAGYTPSIPLACNTLNPRTQDWSRVFVYGTLPTTLMRVVSTAVYGADARPLDIRNVGRTLACIAEIVAILMVYLLARALTVRPLAAVAALLYALAPLPIQLSHFATVDAIASPWVLAALALAVRLPRLRWPGWLALALCIAVAAAMRITLLSLWVLVPLHWLVVRQLPTRRQVGQALLAGSLSLVGLWLCDPTIWNGWWFDARWLHDVLLAGRLVNGMVDTPPTYQWSWQTPFVYPLTQMGWWGMGPLLLLAATLGWLWQSLQPRRRVWLLWLWVTLYLLWQGAVFGMTMRYYLPVYGAACVLAMVGLGRLARPWRTHCVSLLVLGTALMAVGWSGLYATEHPRIVASRWMYAQIPAGATLAVEEWDDVLPLTFSQSERPQRYTVVSLPVYDADRPAKFLATDPNRRGIIDLLDQAEYVIVSSARAQAVIRAMPARFPIMERYYRALADGSLGFVPMFRAERWPHIGPWQWDTRRAEEAFSVYDHPQVVIYAKTAQYSHARAVALLTDPPLWSSVAAVDTRTYRAWPHLGAVATADWQRWRTQPLPTHMPSWLTILCAITLGVLALRRWSPWWVAGVCGLVVLIGLVLWRVEAPVVVHQIAVLIRSGADQPLDPWLAGHLRPVEVFGWQGMAVLGQYLGVAAPWVLAWSGAVAVTLCAAAWSRVGDRWRVAAALLVPIALALAVQSLGVWRDGVTPWLLVCSVVGIVYAWALRRPDALAHIRRWLWWGIIPVLVSAAAAVRTHSWHWPTQAPYMWLLVCWPLLVAIARQARVVWCEAPAQRGVLAALLVTSTGVLAAAIGADLQLWLVLVPVLATSGWLLRHGLSPAWGWAMGVALGWAAADPRLQALLLPWLTAAALWWGLSRAGPRLYQGLVGGALVVIVVLLMAVRPADADPRVARALAALADTRQGVLVVAGADDAVTEAVARRLGLVQYNGIAPLAQTPAVYGWQQLRIARRGQIDRVRTGQQAPSAVAGLDIWVTADGAVQICADAAPLPTRP